MDFIDQLLQADAPIAREVSFTAPDGTVHKGTVHFRRITAGERQRLLQGQRYSMNKDGNVASMKTEIDLALNEAQKHMLVAFSVCRADGSAAFKSPAEVAKLDALKVSALYEAADELNREKEPGKP